MVVCFYWPGRDLQVKERTLILRGQTCTLFYALGSIEGRYHSYRCHSFPKPIPKLQVSSASRDLLKNLSLDLSQWPVLIVRLECVLKIEPT